MGVSFENYQGMIVIKNHYIYPASHFLDHWKGMKHDTCENMDRKGRNLIAEYKPSMINRMRERELQSSTCDLMGTTLACPKLHGKPNEPPLDRNDQHLGEYFILYISE